MYVFVVIPKTSSFYNKLFVYSVPKILMEKAKIGMQVIVPFGKKFVVGYIVDKADKIDEKDLNIKEIHEIKGKCPFFFDIQAKTAVWLSKYYVCFIGSALKTVLMPMHSKYEKIGTKNEFIPLEADPKIIFSIPKFEIKDLCKDLQKIFDKQGYSANLIFNKAKSSLDLEYIKIASLMLKQNKSIILLYPDIEYLESAVKIFKYHFNDYVVVIHSSMTEKERNLEWEKAYDKTKIVLGTRSAIFTPVKNLGIIILDKEEGYSYKQETSPKYNTKDVAEFIAKKCDIPIVYTSNLPKVDSYYKSMIGEYNLLKIYGEESKNFPVIIDMNKEKKVESGIFSILLFNKIEKVLSNNGNILLITARKKHSTALYCADCGNVVKCSKCYNPLIYSMFDKKIFCIKCNLYFPTQIICSNCLSGKIKFSGLGTQKVEAELKRLNPLSKILRIDRDLFESGKITKIVLDNLKLNKVNTLIGTILAEKIIDLHNFDLVALINLDSTLQIGSLNSSEDIFRLIIKLSKNSYSPLYIQTYIPTHYVYKYASILDIEGFYNKELELRKKTFSPPFSKHIKISVFSKNLQFGETKANEIKKCLEKYQQVSLLGPSLSRQKVKGLYKLELLIKGEDLDMIKSDIFNIAFEKQNNKIKLVVDVDPIE